MSENIDKLHFELATNTLNCIIKVLGVYAENRPFVQGSQTIADDHDWYEKNIFNESRLYKALGKDHARTVLHIWEEFKEICHLVRKYKNWEKEEEIKNE
ncbi:hypothetical protein LCGC14_0669480 [marine sediment metagenome]|uniref:Uncharacterized protein n=1 Tax=marine sediment metagenome TaxID=412755 RepID=A0A0F9TZJ3_9ZZZZ|nr:hypothetical protein [Candidatus Aminicenantes bacterium]